MNTFGGDGGRGTSTVNSAGGASGGANLGDQVFGGGDGGWGIGTLGGNGGSSIPGGGITINASGSGSYSGRSSSYNGGGGAGGNNGDGGAGKVGQCVVTEYYY